MAKIRIFLVVLIILLGGLTVYNKYMDSKYLTFTEISPESKLGYDSLKNSQSFSPNTVGKENALRQAKSYLSAMNFSRKGLINQLKYEGYSTSDATYAVDNCNMSWKLQAGLMAVRYLETMSFSRSELENQLVYEGFTYEEASYGASMAYK